MDHEVTKREVELFHTDGHLYERRLGNGRSIYVDPLTFGRARIHTGATDALVYDDAW